MNDIITTKSIGKGIAEVEEDFILCEEPMSRLVFRAKIHNNGIKGKIIRQRRESKSDHWIPEKAIDIRTLGKNETINIDIDSEGVRRLYQSILKIANILELYGIEYGEKKYAVVDPDNVFITDTNKIEYIHKLLNAGYGEEVWLNLIESEPSLTTKLAYARISSERSIALKEFERKINEDEDEVFWQNFFQNNSWIFGYGLDWQFKGILQKECHISYNNIDGSNEVIGDFLLGDKRFTAFVEIKKPNTPLFKTNPNRSNSWRLSNELIESVSQILEQKASGQIKIERDPLYIKGNMLKQHSYDSKVFLIIGSWKEIEKCSEQEKVIKEKTFELFRRDSRNIEIMTYDEILDRAKFIVDYIDNVSLENNQIELEDYDFVPDGIDDL